ncbi:MAG: CPBP family intramembrane glutamic endopeptidase [Acidobacteriaceae bacterium]
MSTIQTELAVDVARSPVAPPKRDRWIDLFFVLGIALWEPIFSSAIHGRPSPGTGPADSNVVVHGLLYEAAGLAALAYVLWKRKAGAAALTRDAHGSDIPIGAALCILTLMVSGVAAVMLHYVWILATGHAPAQPNIPALIGMQPTAAWLIYLLVNPWFEELIVRGFLMTEVTALAGVRTAIIASTLVQVSYHLYQGWFNAAGLAVVFLGLSLYYASTRRLFPVVVAHTLMDLMSFAWFIHHH